MIGEKTMKRGCVCLLLVGLAFPWAQSGRGEDAPPPKDPPARVGKAGITPEMKDKIKRARELLQKRHRGEELTPEERAWLEKEAPELRAAAKRLGMMDPLEPGGFAGGAGPRLPFEAAQWEAQALMRELNVLDRAALTAAFLNLHEEKREEALAAAEKVMDKSPDPNASSLARWIIARIRQEKGETEAAGKLFRQVAGRAAPLALRDLLAPLLKAGDLKGALAAYKELAAAQPSALDRCRLLGALTEHLERLPADTVPLETRTALLARAAETVAYEEAQAAREALQKEREAASLPPLAPGMEAEFGPRGRFMRKPVGKGKLGGPDPDALREKIKLLEEQGRKDEANQLRKELEALQPPIRADF